MEVDIIFCDEDKHVKEELEQLRAAERSYDKKCHGFISVTGEHIMTDHYVSSTTVVENDDFMELTREEILLMDNHNKLLDRLEGLM